MIHIKQKKFSRRNILLYFSLFISPLLVFLYFYSPGEITEKNQFKTDNKMINTKPSLISYTNQKEKPQLQLQPKKEEKTITETIDEIIYFNDAAPFESEDLAHLFDAFYDQYINSDDLTFEEIEHFRNQFSSTLINSEYARNNISMGFRALSGDEASKRNFLINILNKSDIGRELIVSESKKVLETQDESLYWEAFQGLSNFEKSPTISTMDAALSTLLDNNEPNSLTALRYISRLDELPLASPTYKSDVIATLHQTVNSSVSSNKVKAYALKQIYRNSPPAENTRLAEIHIGDQKVHSETVKLTLDSMIDGHIAISDELISLLDRALSRPGVTEDELFLAQQLFEQRQFN